MTSLYRLNRDLMRGTEIPLVYQQRMVELTSVSLSRLSYIFVRTNVFMDQNNIILLLTFDNSNFNQIITKIKWGYFAGILLYYFFFYYFTFQYIIIEKLLFKLYGKSTNPKQSDQIYIGPSDTFPTQSKYKPAYIKNT